MKILHISPELTPWSKAGGLGDAVAGLIKALAAEGHEVRVVSPLYGSVPDQEKLSTLIESLKVNVAGDPLRATCRVRKIDLTPRAEAWFIEHYEYYGAREIYPDQENTAERSCFFGRAALDACLALNWIPDIIHCHDWTTGLIPVILNTSAKGTLLGKSKSILTIHNLQHQGLLSKRVMPFLHLPEWLYHPNEIECYGGVNFLKGGILHATKVTTVSPTYAQEILTPEYGFGLDEFLRRRKADLTGILNGVDMEEWNPATDKNIVKNFDVKKLTNKAACKLDLQKELNLNPQSDIPLIGVVSRLWEQKGLDLALPVLPKFLRTGKIQFVLLGSGDPALENNYKKLAEDFSGSAAVRIGYNNTLAHQVEAGCDFFLMPSRFEPCGLNQLYSMAYGTIPIVRSTGGLADTVKTWNEKSTEGSGIVFNNSDSPAIEWAINQALKLYSSQKDFKSVQKNAMVSEFSWNNSAKEYLRTYKSAIQAGL
jgi:starch synthase